MDKNDVTFDNRKTYGWLVSVLGLTIVLNVITAFIGEGAVEGLEFESVYIDKLVYIQYALVLILIARKVKTTGRIYWISSHRYNAYLQMSDEKRDQIASSFHQIVLKYCVGVIIFSIIAMLIKLSVLVSTLIFSVMMIAMAVHSMVTEMKQGRE